MLTRPLYVIFRVFVVLEVNSEPQNDSMDFTDTFDIIT